MADNNQQLPDSPFGNTNQPESNLPDSPFTQPQASGPITGKLADWMFSLSPVPISGLATTMSHIGQGAEQGWGSGVNTLSKNLDQALTKAGLYNDYTKNQNNYFKSLNEALVRPVVNSLATLGSGALGALTGGFQGVGQTLEDEAQHDRNQGHDNLLTATVGEAGDIIGSTPERVPDLHIPELTAEARSKAVVGEGEQGFFNTKPVSNENLEARQSAAKDAGTPPEEVANPEPPQMDIHQVVRQMNPDLFDEVDRLNDIKSNYKDSLSYAHSQDLADIEKDLTVEQSHGTNPDRIAELNDQLEALKSGEFGPRAQVTRDTFLDNQSKLYDLQPDVVSAYQHAQEIMMSPEEIAEKPELANPRLDTLTEKAHTEGLTKQEWNEYNILSKAAQEKEGSANENLNIGDQLTEALKPALDKAFNDATSSSPIKLASSSDDFDQRMKKISDELSSSISDSINKVKGETSKSEATIQKGSLLKPLSEEAKTNEPVTFKTAKGSEYVVNEDGTTTRNKAFRPEHGEKEQGSQPKSEKTFYVTDEEADALGLFQTEGPKKAIRQRNDGTVGVQYLDGKDAGKFEKRTILTPKTEPGVGLTPVETWKNGERVHFGNKITELKKTGKLQEGSILKPLSKEAGEQKVPGVSKDIEASAIEKGLTKEFINEDHPTFTSTTVKYQAEGIAKLMSENPEDAKAIAFGQKEPPSDLLPSMIFSAVREKAEREGDLNTIKKLARSPVATQTSLHAQSLGMSGKFNDLSPTNIIKTIEKARLNKADVAKETSKDTAKLEAAKQKGLSKQTAKNFAKSIQCEE